MRTRNWKRVALGTTLAFMVLVGGVTVARSQEDESSIMAEDGAAPGGLYRDMDGGYWCGGTCGSNQQCCTIKLVATEPN